MQPQLSVRSYRVGEDRAWLPLTMTRCQIGNSLRRSFRDAPSGIREYVPHYATAFHFLTTVFSGQAGFVRIGCTRICMSGKSVKSASRAPLQLIEPVSERHSGVMKPAEWFSLSLCSPVPGAPAAASIVVLCSDRTIVNR